MAVPSHDMDVQRHICGPVCCPVRWGEINKMKIIKYRTVVLLTSIKLLTIKHYTDNKKLTNTNTI